MMEQSVSYFGAGPAKLPLEVLKEIQNELLEYDDSCVSALEISHRSKNFAKVLSEAEELVRELLCVPSNYKVLFLQGGATGQFAAIPLNLLNESAKASYFVTGTWSEKAVKECKKFGQVQLILPQGSEFTEFPLKENWRIDSDSSYVYFCMNETIHGIEFPEEPEVPKDIPLICDMSSNFFSRPVDVSKYGLIFGGAQKNIGCAGVTLIIVREELLGRCRSTCPSILDYTMQAKNNSLLNTPPTFAIYVLGRVLSWIKRNGGLVGMQKLSLKKSQLLYSTIDSSDGFYVNKIDPEYRSHMNIVFNIGSPESDEDLEKLFVDEAAKIGLLALKGHRFVGGVRASLYNAITYEDAAKLVDFMNDFREQHRN